MDRRVVLGSLRFAKLQRIDCLFSAVKMLASCDSRLYVAYAIGSEADCALNDRQKPFLAFLVLRSDEHDFPQLRLSCTLTAGSAVLQFNFVFNCRYHSNESLILQRYEFSASLEFKLGSPVIFGGESSESATDLSPVINKLISE